MWADRDLSLVYKTKGAQVISVYIYMSPTLEIYSVAYVLISGY